MTSSALQSNEGRQNFQRLARLLIAGATTIERETFDAIHPEMAYFKLPSILKKLALLNLSIYNSRRLVLKITVSFGWASTLNMGLINKD